MIPRIDTLDRDRYYFYLAPESITRLAHLRGLVHGLVGERPGARDDADAAPPVDVARHDADLALEVRTRMSVSLGARQEVKKVSQN